MIVEMFGYVIFISIHFNDVTFFSFWYVLFVPIEKIYRILNTMFHHISQYLKIRKKYSATRRTQLSSGLLWKCGQKRFLLFDISLNVL